MLYQQRCSRCEALKIGDLHAHGISRRLQLTELHSKLLFLPSQSFDRSGRSGGQPDRIHAFDCSLQIGHGIRQANDVRKIERVQLLQPIVFRLSSPQISNRNVRFTLQFGSDCCRLRIESEHVRMTGTVAPCEYRKHRLQCG